MTPAVRGYARQIWSNAIRDHHALHNPFEKTGLPARSSRLDDPDFRVLNEAELEILIEAAASSRSDDYALVLKAMVIVEAYCGIRPGELFAMEWELLEVKGDVFYYDIKWQIDNKQRKRQPKYKSSRLIALPRRAVEAIQAMPRLHPTYLFPACSGGVMYQTLWDSYWGPIRAAAAAADRQRTGSKTSVFDDFDFYELRHKAITWMLTPPPHGPGMDYRDVALVVGHKDGGRTIARHYLRLDELQAAERMAAAFAAAESGPRLRPVS